MSIERDRSSALSAKLRRVQLAGGVVVASTAIWSFWPQRTQVSQSLVAAETEQVERPEGAKWIAAGSPRNAIPLNLQAFDAQLWKLPPKPVEVATAPPPPPPAPPPPLKLQLVGILTSQPNADGGPAPPRAALFDPESNKIYSVPVGETVLRYRVKSITPETVELIDIQLPALPPYVLKMRSSEFAPTPVIRGSRTAKKRSDTTLTPLSDPVALKVSAEGLAREGVK